MDDFRVKKASEILSRFFDERTIQEATQFETFRSSWKQLVGERLADHSRPKSIMHNTLVISADHSGWIQLFQLEQARILKRIEKSYPELQISSLAFAIELQSDDASDKNLSQNDAQTTDHEESSVSVPHAAPQKELPKELDDIFSRLRSHGGKARHNQAN